MKNVALAACAAVALLAAAATARVTQSLNGAAWKLENANGSISIAATVPGQVHLDLLAAKLIGEPYAEFNDAEQAWVARDNWTYSLSFAADAALLSSKSIWLNLDGVDTIANVSLNGISLGTTANMWRRYQLDVTQALKKGDNTLTVTIWSSPDWAAAAYAEYPYPVSYEEYGGPFCCRNFIRRSQVEFGWDFAPSFVPPGIWRNVSLIGSNDALLNDVVPLMTRSADGKTFTVDITAHLLSAAAAVDGVVSATLAGKSASVKVSTTTAGKESEAKLSLAVPANSIKLWWPNGYGSQPLYPLRVTWTPSGSSKDDSWTRSVGFRSLELRQDALPDGEAGLSFYFEVNGVPIFIKGSNWVPADSFSARVSEADVENLLGSAVAAHHNMLRVWGGGIYESDHFYETADRMGLLVWQELMFACALYPRHPAFLDNVAAEVSGQVRRLAWHASIALWSGNNENQELAQNAGDLYVVDYSTLYDDTVRTAVRAVDDARPFWPSSPSNGVLVDQPGMYVQRWGQSESPQYGDVHHYDYVDLCTDVTSFPRPRFASEFGFQSLPSLLTLSAVSSSADWQLNSTFMQHRQHHPDGNKELVMQLRRFFRSPSNANSTQQFSDFAYLTQAVQALCIRAEAEHYRRLRSQPGAYTMGSLYWQLNSIWQAPSWSSLEYGGRWKLLHYSATRFYAPLIVSPYTLAGRLMAYVVNDASRSLGSVTLTRQLWSWNGQLLNTHASKVTVGGATSVMAGNDSLSDALDGHAAEDAFFLWTLTTQTGSNVSAHLFPSSFANVTLPSANLTVSDFVETSTTSIRFTLTASKPAPFVWLETRWAGTFSDNNLLLLPGSRNITFNAWQPVTAEALRTTLTMRSVRDTY